jgi:SAM-dependent methyltransferase
LATSTGGNFDDLVVEGESVPVEGWDFAWFEGRATEERPSWGYANLVVQRMPYVESALDVQTGGGEGFAWILGQSSPRPATLAATESWPPNLSIARENLQPFGVGVAEIADDADLPFGSESFELLCSRHPVVTVWPEVARVLRRGGTYLSQQVGPGSNRELIDFMMGPQQVGQQRSPARAARAAQEAGLAVVDLRQESLRTVFYDVGAVVYFLRKVLWTVPGFTVAAYRDRLASMHELIQQEGSFVAHSERFFVEARKVA